MEEVITISHCFFMSISKQLKADSQKRLSLFFILALLLLCTPAVVHAQWEPDVRLTFDDSASWTSDNNAHCISASPGGILHVVWFDQRYRKDEIYYKRSTNEGVSWSQDIRLTNDSAYSEAPSISVSDSSVYVVWGDSREGTFKIHYKHSSDQGITWSQDIRLPNSPSYSWGASVSAFGSFVHVVWVDGCNGNDEIYYKRSTDQGTTWSLDTPLTNDSAYSGYPSIYALGPNVHVVWIDDRNGPNYEIFYKRSTDQGISWSLDTRLTFNPDQSVFPSVSAFSSNVYIVWMDLRDGSGYHEIYFKRSTDDGASWSQDVRLTYDSASSYSPSVLASGSRVHLVWADNRNGGWPNDEIYYKRSTDQGITWSQDTRLTYDLAWSGRPSLALTDTMIHVVWADGRNGYQPNMEIYYKRNPTGNSGVEESSGSLYPLTSNLSFSVVPNPFTSFATVPGREAERFTLYDISGRKVGVFKGDRIGFGLSAGVYFLKPQGQDSKSLRIVKLR